MSGISERLKKIAALIAIGTIAFFGSGAGWGKSQSNRSNPSSLMCLREIYESSQPLLRPPEKRFLSRLYQARRCGRYCLVSLTPFGAKAQDPATPAGSFRAFDRSNRPGSPQG
jgi:hypothetical protein